jgi:hypothetical protein
MAVTMTTRMNNQTDYYNQQYNARAMVPDTARIFTRWIPAYTRAGINVALTNYTPVPSASLAEITLQQLRALAWLYRNADSYDFDPRRIIVSGHSAGGHLTAMALAALWPVFAPDLPRDLVRPVSCCPACMTSKRCDWRPTSMSTLA